MEQTLHGQWRRTKSGLARRVRCLVCSFTYPARHDLLIDLDGLVGEERWVAGRHLVHEHPERPPVDRLVVALISN